MRQPQDDKRIGYRLPLLVSMILAVLGAVFFLGLGRNISDPTSIICLALGLGLFGLSLGIHIPASINGVLSQVAAEKSGSAMGLFFTVGISIGTIGIAVTAAILKFASLEHLKLALLQHGISLPKGVMNKLAAVANGSQNVSSLHSADVNLHEIFPLAQQAFLKAFHYADLVFILLALIGALLAWKTFNLTRKNKV